jgi:predicted DNA-binding ribbon-helix-helix protein
VNLWLYCLGNVNISDYGNYSIRLACKSGNLALVEWLRSISCGLEDLNYQIFRMVCEQGHLSVAQWLLTESNIHIHQPKSIRQNLSRTLRIICVQVQPLASSVALGLLLRSALILQFRAPLLSFEDLAISENFWWGGFYNFRKSQDPRS